MSVYKGLIANDVSYRDYFAYKQWVITDTDPDVKVRDAIQETGSYFYPTTEPSQSFIYERTLYDSIKHLYYNKKQIVQYSASLPNQYTKALNVTGTGSAYYLEYYPPPFNFGPNGGNTYKCLENRAVVVSIPQSFIGDRMKPGTVHVEDTDEGFTLIDDGWGNLYDSDESASFVANKKTYTRGNVFYEHGNIVITSLSASYQNFGTGSNNYIIKYKSTQKIHEMEAICTAKEGEFNITMNPSARVSRSLLTSEPLGFVTSSDFRPYVTTVGLYNSDGWLVAIGKPAEPIRNDDDLAMTFVIRLDW